MRIIEQALAAPGCCVITGDGDGPFVETDHYTMYAGRRFVITAKLATRLGETVGMVPGEEVARVVSSIEDELAQLREWKEAAQADLDDYVALRGAVAQVLRGGLAVDKKGLITPKPWPGVQAPRDLDEPTAVERLEDERAADASQA